MADVKPPIYYVVTLQGSGFANCKIWWWEMGSQIPPPEHTFYHRIRDTLTLLWEIIWCLFSEYSNQVTQGIREGTWDTINTLKFRASPGDDGSEIRCVAEHRALKHRKLERKIDLTVYCEYSKSHLVTLRQHSWYTRRIRGRENLALAQNWASDLCWSEQNTKRA